MTDYSKLDYWEERYEAHSDPFDWYQIYSTLKEKIGSFIKTTDKVLVLGAGTSSKKYLFSKKILNFFILNFLALSESMYEDGIMNITNIDYSPSVVKLMQNRYHEMGCNIQYKEMNVTDMSDLKNNEFNVIIDKGTLDSVLCGENSIPLVDKMMREVYRILDHNGVYFCISYGDEDHRKTFFVNKIIF
jgi:EEF1A lysine methyltransferase 4